MFVSQLINRPELTCTCPLSHTTRLYYLLYFVLIGCDETRTVGAQSVQNAALYTARSSRMFELEFDSVLFLCYTNKPRRYLPGMHRVMTSRNLWSRYDRHFLGV